MHLGKVIINVIELFNLTLLISKEAIGLDYKIEWPGMISNSQVIVSVGPGLTMPEDQIFFKRET